MSLRWPHVYLLLPLLALGCRGDDVPDTMCVDQAAAFEEEYAGEGQLLDSVVESGPYVVSMVISEQGINKLLDNVIDQEVPFTGEVPFGLVDINFEPTSTPVIQFADLPDCPTCILYSLEFNIQMSQQGEPVSSGIGDVQLQIPLTLELDGEESTTLVANYDEITIEEMNLAVFGFDSDEHKALAGAIETILTETIQETYQPTNLLKLEPWDIGEGNIRLLTRHLFVFPEENSMALAMATNLDLPTAKGLERRGDLPEGIDLGFRFEAVLLDGMARRMMAEGEIPRRYNSSGEPDSDGIYGVTLESITGNEEAGDHLETRFRAWRTDLGYCGNALAQVPMAVSIEDNGLAVEPGAVLVLEGEGSGKLATEEEEFVDEHQDVVATFNSSLAGTLGDTLSYDALSIEGSTIIFDARDVVVDAETVTTHMDFLVLANE